MCPSGQHLNARCTLLNIRLRLLTNIVFIRDFYASTSGSVREGAGSSEIDGFRSGIGPSVFRCGAKLQV